MSLPRLLQLVSPALPVGGYTYSRGLETAVERGWVTDEAQTRAWIAGLLEHSVATLDGPLVVRLHRALAGGDMATARRWARLADATRETSELQAESRQTGRALVRLLVDLELADPPPAPIREAHVAAFALASVALGLDADTALRGFLWTWLEGTVAAAIKLVPLGQTAGQRILLQLGPELERAAERAATLPDEALGALAPGLALASALHETQHTRLFRS
ncbi:MAG: urease accessory protein UreF [Deltaproteobacteria bacterium]|nr:urease accessory protein UreF [Deltaproteobacteria bacterium]